MTIYNISICRCGDALSGGEKFTDEVITRWAKKYSSINYFGWVQSLSKLNDKNNIRTINILNYNPNMGSRIRIFHKLFGKRIRQDSVKNYLEMQSGDVLETYADIKQTKYKLGWEPRTPIEDAVHLFVGWYKEFYDF